MLHCMSQRPVPAQCKRARRAWASGGSCVIVYGLVQKSGKIDLLTKLYFSKATRSHRKQYYTISTGDDVAKLHRDVYTLVLGNVQYTKQLGTDEDEYKA